MEILYSIDIDGIEIKIRGTYELKNETYYFSIQVVDKLFDRLILPIQKYIDYALKTVIGKIPACYEIQLVKDNLTYNIQWKD